MKIKVTVSLLVFLFSLIIAYEHSTWRFATPSAHAAFGFKVKPAHARKLVDTLSATRNMCAGVSSRALNRAMDGASLGATVGSVAGPWGTVAGAAIGLLAGGVIGYFDDQDAIAATVAKQETDHDLRLEINELMRAQGMTQNQITTVYQELSKAQAQSKEEILGVVRTVLTKIDATQEQIHALSDKLCAKVEETQQKMLQATENLKNGQKQMLARMDAVDQRLEKEFRILGEDLKNRHAAQMAALSANLQAITKLEGSVGELNQNLLAGFAQLGDQIRLIDEKLNRIEEKLDILLQKFDASVKAYLRDGNDFLRRYYATHDVNDLKTALKAFIHFKNAYAPSKNELEEAKTLRNVTYYNILLCQMELVKNGIHPDANLKLAEDTFKEFLTASEDTAFINFAYVLFKGDPEIASKATLCDRLFVNFYKARIAAALQKGDINTAKAFAETLDTLYEKDNPLSKATYAYIKTGKDKDHVFQTNAVLSALTRAMAGEKHIDSDTLPPYARNIIANKAEPKDYAELLTQFNSSDFVIFAIRRLLENGYKDAAFEVLKTHDTANDDFRIKAFLYQYSERNKEKFAAYKKLILEDPTISQEVKEFAKQM